MGRFILGSEAAHQSRGHKFGALSVPGWGVAVLLTGSHSFSTWSLEIQLNKSNSLIIWPGMPSAWPVFQLCALFLVLRFLWLPLSWLCNARKPVQVWDSFLCLKRDNFKGTAKRKKKTPHLHESGFHAMNSLNSYLLSFIPDFLTVFTGVNRVCLAMSLIVCYMMMTCMCPE